MKVWDFSHTKEEFCAAAEKVPHPADAFSCIPDAAKVNVFRLLTAGVGGPAKERIANQTMIMQTMPELRVEEARLHATLPAHVQQVLRGKNLLLWHHLLKKTGFSDLGVWDLMLGTDIVRAPSKSALYGWKEKRPTLSAEGLLQSASWRRRRMSQTSVRSDDPVLQATLWETTLREVQEGFLQGPFNDEQEVQAALQAQSFVCNRRFVIDQSSPTKVKFRGSMTLKKEWRKCRVPLFGKT